MRTKYHGGSFIAQILISLTALQFHSLSSTPFFLLFAPSHSLQPLSVHLSAELSCFEAPFLFVSYCLDFPPSLILSSALSIHLYFHPPLFSPGACWCSLITGARRRLLPAALLCEGCARITCVRVCV